MNLLFFVYSIFIFYLFIINFSTAIVRKEAKRSLTKRDDALKSNGQGRRVIKRQSGDSPPLRHNLPSDTQLPSGFVRASQTGGGSNNNRVLSFAGQPAGRQLGELGPSNTFLRPKPPTPNPSGQVQPGPGPNPPVPPPTNGKTQPGDEANPQVPPPTNGQIQTGTGAGPNAQVPPPNGQSQPDSGPNSQLPPTNAQLQAGGGLNSLSSNSQIQPGSAPNAQFGPNGQIQPQLPSITAGSPDGLPFQPFVPSNGQQPNFNSNFGANGPQPDLNGLPQNPQAVRSAFSDGARSNGRLN